jgi:hypothetical protein
MSISLDLMIQPPRRKERQGKRLNRISVLRSAPGTSFAGISRLVLSPLGVLGVLAVNNINLIKCAKKSNKRNKSEKSNFY